MSAAATATNETSITIEDLRKRYDGARPSTQAFAVDGVSFDVPRGQFVTLLGPSGCGKTTTLRCVAGLEQPTGGRITMAGRVVFEEGKKRAVRPEDRPIAMVPQSYGIWPHMTVIQNVAFPLRHGRNHRGQRNIRGRALEALEQVGLDSFADRWATQLSGGQQQRLALARALISEPEVLLLDEPLSNLDAKLRTKLRGELRTFQEQFGITTVYVTHDQAEALAMSDTVILMNQGKVEQIDAPERIYSHPASAFVADFIGSANLLRADHAERSSGGVLADTAIGAILCSSDEQEAPSADGSVCIRPENIEVLPPHEEGTNMFAGRIGTVEFLGDRLELTIDLSGTVLTAAVAAGARLIPGDRVTVHVAPGHARWLAR